MNTTQAVESETRSFQSTELDLPESTAGILLALAALAALFTITIRTSLRDSRFLSRFARTALLFPRLLVLLILLAILLNPRSRTQLSRIEKSRVGIVLDTSLSMQWPADDPAAASPAAAANSSTTPPPANSESRSDAIVRQLLTSPVLADLSRTHSVSIYTFDSTLTGPWAVISDGTVRFVSPSSNTDTTSSGAADSNTTRQPAKTPSISLDTAPKNSTAAAIPLTDPTLAARWQQLLQPRGSETRMGESVYQLIGQMAGRTLAGVVLVSDGRNNAGLDTEPARLRAERSSTRLLSVGVGSLKPRLNLRVAGMQSPRRRSSGRSLRYHRLHTRVCRKRTVRRRPPLPAVSWQQRFRPSPDLRTNRPHPLRWPTRLASLHTVSGCSRTLRLYRTNRIRLRYHRNHPQRQRTPPHHRSHRSQNAGADNLQRPHARLPIRPQYTLPTQRCDVRCLAPVSHRRKCRHGFPGSPQTAHQIPRHRSRALRIRRHRRLRPRLVPTLRRTANLPQPLGL